MIEEWKDIPGYEELYQVSNIGRIKALPKEWNQKHYSTFGLQCFYEN